MMLVEATKRFILAILGVGFFVQHLLEARDPNILVYVDRGIKYYPRYVPEGL